MNITENDLIITLDNGKRYTLVNTLNKNDIQYACLTNIEDFGDIIFGKLEDNKITVIKDDNLLVDLIKSFNEMNQNNQ